jgi:hypothetical protein
MLLFNKSRTELTELLSIHVKHGALDMETGREVAGAMQYKDRQVRVRIYIYSLALRITVAYANISMCTQLFDTVQLRSR